MIIRLAFQKNPSVWDIMARIIKWWDNTDYFHIEIIINGKWISSNTDTGGVSIKDLRPYTDKWDYIDVKVADSELYDVMQFLRSQEDKKYDWCGILCAQVFGMRRHTEDRWFCSELVTEVLKRFGEPKVQDCVPSVMSPADLFELYKGK